MFLLNKCIFGDAKAFTSCNISSDHYLKNMFMQHFFFIALFWIISDNFVAGNKIKDNFKIRMNRALWKWDEKFTIFDARNFFLPQPLGQVWQLFQLCPLNRPIFTAREWLRREGGRKEELETVELASQLKTIQACRSLYTRGSYG